MKKLLALIAILLISGHAYAANTSIFHEYHSGNHDKAKIGLIKLVKSGNRESIYYMAIMYLHGYGVIKNRGTGITLMTQSAKLNYLPAQMYLGKYYLFDQKKLSEAVPWFRMAANNGNRKAQMLTAIAYLKGYGVKKNNDKAQRYVIMAAKNGNVMAQYELALLFLQSKHRSNRKMGKIWLKKAAERGYPAAQEKLGLLLLEGKVFKKDEISAIEWLQKAAQQGSVVASQQLAQLNGVLDETDKEGEQSGQAKVEKNQNTKNVLDKREQLQAMLDTLKKAGITISRNKIITNPSSSITMSSKLIPRGDIKLFRPDFSLITSQTIPIDKIIEYVTNINYQHGKSKIHAESYPFEMPQKVKNYSEALVVLTRDAKHGHAHALFELGQMYQRGLGVKEDEQKAYELYVKSAEQNYVRAQYMIGLFYLEGRGVEKNYHTAVRWFAKAALRGSRQAQLVLGSIYEHGAGAHGNPDHIAKDLKKAQAMYNLAAHNGLPIAQYRLAQLYASGLLNTAKDADTQRSDQKHAYNLYQEAANQGVVPARVALALFLNSANKKSNDQEKVIKSVKQQAGKGDENADLILAIIYNRGLGADHSVNKSMRIFKKLAKKGNPYAQFALGTYYYKEGSKEKGIQLLEKSAQQKCAFAQYNLAVLTYKNQYNSPGESFVSLVRQAVKNNYNKAAILLADYYLVERDDSKALSDAAKIYRQLADRGDSSAELKLGVMYEKGIVFKKQYQTAFEWFKKSADHGNTVAQYITGNMYQLGKGVDRNISQAIYYYTLSAKKKYLPAQLALGYVYEIDIQDYAKAHKWYMRAAQHDNPQAQYNLCLMYEYAKHKKDAREAFGWCKKAAEQNYVFAQRNIANMYLHGVGVSANAADAVYWFKKAVKQHDSRSMYQLGLMNESGVGTHINLITAREYYEKAAAAGNVKAKIALARLYELASTQSDSNSKALSYYQSAAHHGNAFAKRNLLRLKHIDSDAQENTNVNLCLENLVKIANNHSFWKKFSNLFSAKPNKLYMHAINDLNEGKTQSASTKLQKIISDYPDFTPAQRTFRIICKQAATQPHPKKSRKS